MGMYYKRGFNALAFIALTLIIASVFSISSAQHHSNLLYTTKGQHNIDKNSKTGSTGAAGLIGWFKSLHHKVVGQKVSVNLFGKSGGTGVGDGVLKSVSEQEVVVEYPKAPAATAAATAATTATAATGPTGPATTGPTGLTGPTGTDFTGMFATAMTGATGISGLEAATGINLPCKDGKTKTKDIFEDVNDPKVVRVGSPTFKIMSDLKFLAERVTYTINRNKKMLSRKKDKCAARADVIDNEMKRETNLIDTTIGREEQARSKGKHVISEYNEETPIIAEMTKAHNGAMK